MGVNSILIGGRKTLDVSLFSDIILFIMSIDFDKYRGKIPKTPAVIPFTFIGDVNIDEKLKKVFGTDKVFSNEQLQKIKSYSLALRDFLININTILLFAKNDLSSIDDAIEKQYKEEKETMGRTILKFLLKKDISELTYEEKKMAIEFGLGIFDKHDQFHLHPIVKHLKNSK